MATGSEGKTDAGGGEERKRKEKGGKGIAGGWVHLNGQTLDLEPPRALLASRSGKGRCTREALEII